MSAWNAMMLPLKASTAFDRLEIVDLKQQLEIQQLINTNLKKTQLSTYIQTSQEFIKFTSEIRKLNLALTQEKQLRKKAESESNILKQRTMSTIENYCPCCGNAKN